MRLLADENVDRILIAWLRSSGREVLSVKEFSPGISDEQVLALALGNSLPIVTQYLDFGELVISRGSACAGLLLVRLSNLRPADFLARFIAAWSMIEVELLGHFIVLGEQRIRVRALRHTP